MTARLILDSRYAYLSGAPLELVKEISLASSFLVKGREHSSAYQDGYWDGRKRLVSMMRDGRIRIPIGLAQDAVDILTTYDEPCEITNIRREPEQSLRVSFDESVLHPYQLDAVQRVTTLRGSLGLRGCGIIKMPPRSGKTLVGAAIIARLGVPALFVVPAKTLLYQAQRELSRRLGVEVGIIGDEEFELRDVTVATIQTLYSLRGGRRKSKNGTTKTIPTSSRYAEVFEGRELVIMDELHHLQSDEWRKVIQDSRATYRIGLSATVFLDHEQECELGVIWLRACTGDMLVDISVSDLIEQGYLVRPNVRLYPIRRPELNYWRRWSNELQRQAIFRNEYRNGKIVDVTAGLARQEMRTVIIANRHEQVDELCGLMRMAGLRFERVVGETPQRQREKAIARLCRQEIDVIIGTVFGEGVDIPEVDACVNAEGGYNIKKCYQRLRCLTPHNGKTKAVLVDFVDLMHPYFAAHSRDRLSVYRGERAFQITVEK